ncbi:MAG TPA: intradiol ring-cleavage dioxygenase [Gaiellaceae bacterium]
MERTLTRRRALGWLGGLGLAVVIPGCADDDSADSSAGATTTTETTATTTSPDCVLTPELTEGPYYLDLDLMRSDITEGRPGLPYDLDVKVVDADSCEPIEDAAVDVWHCDAEGVYSGVQGDDGTFLRGVQLTDASGDASFRTVFPGWYTGRAVHIHLKVIQGGQTWTGQLFFDDATLDRVYALDPYSSRGPADTSNSSDGIFGQSGGSTVVATDVAADLAAGQVTVGVERA